MRMIKNIEIEGKHSRPIITDLFFNENETPKQVVIFCHGYKGFKDWGAWNLVAEKFAEENIFFIKMNFSHNGGTKEQPIDFPDLEAFGQNNFLKELDDLDSVIEWVCSQNDYQKDMKVDDISLIGHSRGGGIVTLKAASEQRISRIITWAGVSDFASRFPTGEPLDQWREKGVAYVTNARTNQQMPHYFQFYTTFKEHEESLTIKTALENLTVPFLILHGNADETVTLEEAKNLHAWYPKSKLDIIAGANHTFGAAQPWLKATMPDHLAEVCKHSLTFIKG